MAPARAIPRILTRDEARTILAQVEARDFHGFRDRALLELLYRAGVRSSEACGLGVTAVQFQAQPDPLITVATAKGGQARVIPMPELLFHWMHSWSVARKQMFPEGSPFFFVTKTNKQLANTWVRQVVNRYVRKADMDPLEIHPHTFRHTCATELLEEGFNIREVQQILGHKNLMSTSFYLHVRPTELAAKFMGRGDAKRRDAEDLTDQLMKMDEDVLLAMADFLASVAMARQIKEQSDGRKKSA